MIKQKLLIGVFLFGSIFLSGCIEGEEEAAFLATVETMSILENPFFTQCISGTSARTSVNVVDNGTFVTEYGLCWNKTGNPTINDSKCNELTPGFLTDNNIFGLIPDTIYYVRGYAINKAGTAYGNEISFNSGKEIGKSFGGGYVFFNDGTGHGLIAAYCTQSLGQFWIEGGSTQTEFIGNTSTKIGTGQANTTAIINQNGHINSAAKLCDTYTKEGFSDWYLPSVGELNLIYCNLFLKKIGMFSWSSIYASSSEFDGLDVYCLDFNNGYQVKNKKNSSFCVHPVRSF